MKAVESGSVDEFERELRKAIEVNDAQKVRPFLR